MGLTSKDLPVMPRPEGPPPDPVDTSPVGIQIEDVKRLTLNPGDVLVVHIPFQAEVGTLRDMARQMEAFLPGNKVLVIAQGVELEVVGPESDAEQAAV